MVELHQGGVYYQNGRIIPADAPEAQALPAADQAREGTIAYSILRAHDRSDDPKKMRITFDALVSHDITYVGIIQTARASGLTRFPVPYAMTNCHNSLCAVGGTINEDDHVFGLSAAKKYGGIFVPPNQAVIHQYAREMLAGCGKMILGSDSHTRFGALGTMGIGEGGPEIVKQLLENTYDVPAPQVVMVYLENAPRPGVGPHDVAIALVGAVFQSGFVANKVLEFVGPGVAHLPADFRIGIDVMTTETACLSSIWQTDEETRRYLTVHGRADAYRPLAPADGAYYDSMVKIDLAKVECMVAMPFHPSNAYTVHQLQQNAGDILRAVEKEAAERFPKANISLVDKLVDGKIVVDQGIIAGCAGGLFDSICEAAAILDGADTGDGYFSLSVYPSSVPLNLALIKNGVQQKLLEAGAVFKPCFCGPCFGAGDVPANNGLSIRHTTRNFPNREGSKPGEGQASYVALMDARSIAATARNQGVLTAATDVEYDSHPTYEYTFDQGVYQKRVYQGYGKPDADAQLRLGPNIADWPRMDPLSDNVLLRLAAVIHDPVTTTDELIPSGETSSYRSNPLRLAQFTLSRREPEYVARSQAVQKLEQARQAGKLDEEVRAALAQVGDADALAGQTQIGSCIFSRRPGDGSAREQAASCQKVLGGYANICYEYATKRYRSNCINWGILPFTLDADTDFPYENGDFIFVPDIRRAVEEGMETISAQVIAKDGVHPLTLHIKGLTADEKQIILDGCLINFYAAHRK